MRPGIYVCIVRLGRLFDLLSNPFTSVPTESCMYDIGRVDSYVSHSDHIWYRICGVVSLEWPRSRSLVGCVE